MATAVLAAGLALAGCRAADRGAAGRQAPAQPPAAVQSAAPAASTAANPGGSTADVDVSDVDALLKDLDNQLNKADQAPADGD